MPFENKTLFSLYIGKKKPQWVLYRVNRRSQLLNERRQILSRFESVLEETKSRRRNTLSHDWSQFTQNKTSRAQAALANPAGHREGRSVISRVNG